MSLFAAIERHDRLGIETEPVVIECLVDTPDPLHFSVASGQFGIFRVIGVNAVTPLVLGEITGSIGLLE